MAKKSACYLDYEVVVEDNYSITVRKSGERMTNSMAALRKIAMQVGFEISAKYNTQQAGSKLVDYLKEKHASGSPKTLTEVSPVSGPKAQPAEEKPQIPTAETEELSEEEMKQIDDILKRMQALENRIAALENSVSSGVPDNPATKTPKLKKVVDIPYVKAFHMQEKGIRKVAIRYKTDRDSLKEIEHAIKYDYSHVFEHEGTGGRTFYIFSDGSICKEGRQLGFTIAQIRPIAEALGIPVEKNMKTDVLKNKIMMLHGVDGYAHVDGYVLTPNMGVMECFASDSFDLDDIEKSLKNEFLMKSCGYQMKDIPTGFSTDEERLIALARFIKGLTPHNDYDCEKELAYYREYFSKLS